MGKALYFGGYDAEGGNCHNTAWIYRGEFSPDECEASSAARIDIRSKAKWLSVNDSLKVEVVVDNYSSNNIDMYAALAYNGSFYWYPLWNEIPNPTVIDSETTWSDTIVSVTITKEIKEAIEEFRFYAAVTEHETYNIVDLDSVYIKIE
jgi:hypothetical protein